MISHPGVPARGPESSPPPPLPCGPGTSERGQGAAGPATTDLADRRRQDRRQGGARWKRGAGLPSPGPDGGHGNEVPGGGLTGGGAGARYD